jgi:hypothetical protein
LRPYALPKIEFRCIRGQALQVNPVSRTIREEFLEKTAAVNRRPSQMMTMRLGSSRSGIVKLTFPGPMTRDRGGRRTLRMSLTPLPQYP